MSADHQTDYGRPLEIGRISAFNHSEFAQLLGMKITEAYDGYARVIMDCSGKNNPRSVAHGGRSLLLLIRHLGSQQKVAQPLMSQYPAIFSTSLRQPVLL
jgi:hypothetical protein